MGALAVRTQGETFLLFKRSDYVSDSVVLVTGRGGRGDLVCWVGIGVGIGLGIRIEPG